MQPVVQLQLYAADLATFQAQRCEIMTRRHRTLENTEGRSRDMMQTRTHPLLASHNPWTWKFLPGVALGFLAHWWLSKNKEQKVAKCSCYLQDSSTADQSNCVYFCQDAPKTAERPAAKKRQQAVQPPEEELKMVGFAAALTAAVHSLSSVQLPLRIQVLCVNQKLGMRAGKIGNGCAHPVHASRTADCIA